MIDGSTSLKISSSLEHKRSQSRLIWSDSNSPDNALDLSSNSEIRVRFSGDAVCLAMNSSESNYRKAGKVSDLPISL